jgi:O-6-methylguanine DNA methyltransferase
MVRGFIPAIPLILGARSTQLINGKFINETAKIGYELVGDYLMKVDSIKTEEEVIEALKDKTQFERDVLVVTFRIPKGKVSTYKRIAERICRPKACRAVANALHKNPLWPVVPCHRVVGSDGSFCGPEKAANERRNSVTKEGVPIKDGKVKVSTEIVW